MEFGPEEGIDIYTILRIKYIPSKNLASQVALGVKNLATGAGDLRDTGLIPGRGRTPGGGRGNPLQYSCLENPTDRGAWRATVHGVAQNQTRLKRLRTHGIRTYCSAQRTLLRTL